MSVHVTYFLLSMYFNADSSSDENEDVEVKEKGRRKEVAASEYVTYSSNIF